MDAPKLWAIVLAYLIETNTDRIIIVSLECAKANDWHLLSVVEIDDVGSW